MKNGVVVLNWTPGNDSRITRRRVMRREPRQEWIAVWIPANASSYTDDAVKSRKRYIYRVERWTDERDLDVSNRVLFDVE